MKKLKNLVLAGTFDHLHAGHQQFILQSLQKAENTFCGLTTDWVNQDKSFPLSLQPFHKRLTGLKKFIQQTEFNKRVKFFSLNDPYGRALTDQKLDSISVTKDTYQGALTINKKRKFNGFKPLKILELDLIKAQDQQKISSTRIRSGEINRQGLVYSQLFSFHKTIYLPYKNRSYFRKPLGKLITSSSANLSWACQKIKMLHAFFVITVGDITTQAFILNRLPINLAVLDNRSQRQDLPLKLNQTLKQKADFNYFAKNNPASLSYATLVAFKKALPQITYFNKKGIIQVQGEEDLLVLPAILLSPLKTYIFYGQPNKGLVQIEVTEKIKSKALSLLSKFSTG